MIPGVAFVSVLIVLLGPPSQAIPRGDLRKPWLGLPSQAIPQRVLREPWLEPPKQAVPQGVFQDINDAKKILGLKSKILYDNSGKVIGVEAMEESSDRERPSPTSQGSVSAICCSTREAFYFNTTLKDYHGTTYTIAQQPQINSFQFIRHGLCGKKGLCPGQCEQMHASVALVVHPTSSGQDVTFRFFKIPTYCTCRVQKFKNNYSIYRSPYVMPKHSGRATLY